jgi:iron complex transport system ATP-binding protein
MLVAKSLAIGYPRRTLARDISFTLARGEAIAVLGPNGSGKTTLFRTLLGLQPAHSGAIMLNEKDIRHVPRQDFARAIAYVPQAGAAASNALSAFDFSVIEVVEMARVAHITWYAAPSKRDREYAYQALDIVGMITFAERRYAELSGGERQLVMIARALATGAATILLDEPTASLDFGNQLLVMDEIAKLTARGTSILFTTHQPSQARQLATRLIAINRQGEVTIGEPASLLTSAFIANLYGVSEAALARADLQSAI